MPPRLKSLELHGYKTFASKTNFEFPGTITAIVGPNGSGKSNVADSLRWVLGEQAFSLLRGRKTEDMIFAGSEARPRASMASANIVFNNEDGWLPIDFNEVSITRRAYRDGDNEYLLNGQKVRLKEINELLAQSGLAERTYTIIGQGLVDTALSLKPEERRKFFEEAAGIGLYRGRREEAINRLETTHRNLDRVQDILGELTPRLQGLERQAKKAQEYERIRADLRLLLRDWYGYHWHRTQKEMAHTREVVHAQEDLLSKARDRQHEIDEQVERVRLSLGELRKQLNLWHEESARLHTRSEEISKTLAVLEERQIAARNLRHTLESDLGRIADEEKVIQEKIEGLSEELERVQAELDDAREQSAQAQKNLQQRQQERARLEDQLRERRRALNAAETRQVQLKARQTEIQNRIEELQRNLDNIEQALDTADEQLAATEERLKKSTEIKTAHDKQIKEKEEALQSLRSENGKLEGEIRNIREELSKQEASRVKLHAQLEVIEQAERTFAGLNKGARFVLETAGKGSLPGKYRPFMQLIEVQPDYETAIAAVMGELLDSVLLEQDTDPEPALKLLEEGERGRTALLPVDWAAGGSEIKKLDAPEILGNACDFIKSSDALAPVVKSLFGQVWIIQDRKQVRSLLEKLPKGGRLVTLRGEIFTSQGLVIAGRDGRTEQISRPRQKRELQEALQKMDEQIEKIRADMQQKNNQLTEMRSRQNSADQEIRELNRKTGQINQDHQKATLDREQARQKLDWQKNQQKNLEVQILRSRQEVDQMGSEIEKAGKEITSVNDQVRQCLRSLNDLPLDEFQVQVVHWNTASAVADRALKEAERREQERKQQLASVLARREQVLQKIKDLETSTASLTADKEHERQQEAELSQLIEQLQEKIIPAEKELETQDGDYIRLQDTQAAARQTVSVAERHASQAQIELTRQREALDSLRRRIEEDFGLVAFEYAAEVAGPTPLPLDGMVEQLPQIRELPAEFEDNINRQRALLRRMGPINLEAQTEYKEVKERFDFLSGQVEDLNRADADLRQVIAELDELMKREFHRTFHLVAAEFKQMFTRLFGGGSAQLIMTDAENITETGIDILARLPGRREQGLSLLSGGERCLTAVALIFSLIKVSPTPFCVMDEVDAMLDEANVGRFCELLRELSQNSQFIVITHNRNTVQVADVIYGITMGKDNASQMISLRMDEVSEDMVH